MPVNVELGILQCLFAFKALLQYLGSRLFRFPVLVLVLLYQESFFGGPSA